MNWNRIGKWFMITGVTCIVSAGVLTGYNVIESLEAGRSAAAILGKVEGQTPDTSEASMIETVDGIEADIEMPTIMVDGKSYIGQVEIPDLAIELPVLDEWDYEQAKKAPCRYDGSVYDGSLIIAGHSYKSHFGRISSLGIGAEVHFTDVLGKRFTFNTVEIEEIDGDDIEAMKTGDWDLTLFSCTPDGKKRYALRCISEK